MRGDILSDSTVTLLGGMKVDSFQRTTLEPLQKKLDSVGIQIKEIREIKVGDYICVIPPRNSLDGVRYAPLSIYKVSQAGNKFNDDGNLEISSNEPDTAGIYISTSEEGPHGFILNVGQSLKKEPLKDFSLVEITTEEIQDGLIYKVDISNIT